MGRHEDYSIPPNPNLYPEELQLKLYQAFIFSIPILFFIILFLLFYIFYIKRRSNTNSMSLYPPTTLVSNQQSSSFVISPWNMDIKGELKDKLHVVLFDDELRARDSLCCVCLGEFEMKEELLQLSLCKHVFHGDCIRHWLRANATCPLCRCSAIKTEHPIGLELGPGSGPTHQGSESSAHEQEQGNVGSSSNTNIILSTSQEHVIQIVEEPN